MTFKEENVDDFLRVFKENSNRIRNYPGCSHVDLLRDIKNSNIFFTYSHWENEAALNDYRGSELFGTVWETVKLYFNDKPEAWSVEKFG